MTIFDQIKSIAFTKQHLDVMEAEQVVSPYMIQRWLSMYSAPLAMLVNATSNVTWRGNTDPQQFINLLEIVIPKLQFARISYIKKPLAEHEESKKQLPVQLIADMLQISQKEASEYCQLDPQFAARFEDMSQLFRKNRLNNENNSD